MTREDKELLLKDLCSRLPYGVKVQYERWNEETEEYIDVIDVLYSIDAGKWISVLKLDEEVYIEGIKSYLFPLSSMTEEQRNEYDCICAMSGFDMSELDADKLITFFHENHIDYRGLIDKGLAIDATNKNIY